MGINVKTYQDQMKLTISVIKLYQMLANLEKQNILGEEYKKLINLLSNAITYEKKSISTRYIFTKITI